MSQTESISPVSLTAGQDQDPILNALLVLEDKEEALLLRKNLEAVSGVVFNIHEVPSPGQALQLLDTNSYELLFADYSLPGFQDILQLQKGASCSNATALIVLIPGKDRELAVKCLEDGALDYLLKGKENSETLNRILRYYSERTRLLSDLEKTRAELENSRGELEQFAYISSHDLQEPLRMISSYLGLLTQRSKGQLDQSNQEFIGFAVDGARRMKNMIHDILDFSRVNSRGKEFIEVSLNKLAEDARSTLEKDYPEVVVQFTIGDLPVLWVDRNQMIRVLRHLFDNALKYRSGPSVKIHTDSRKVGSEWIFSVRDNGIGIDERFFERIFTIFQKLHTPEEYEGTGVGLALSKRIIERHGGRVWVESKKGEGCTFFFTLPAP
jgi:signal transduction histidine kinase